MTPTHNLSKSIPVLALLTLIAFLISGLVNLTLADDGGLGKKIAGTYLAVQENASQVMQISREGNLSFIFSIQFDSSGAAGLPFSNTLGSWEKVGNRRIKAKAANISFDSFDGGFAGVAAATYVIEFDEKFQTAKVTCEGAIFPPGVNPFVDFDGDPLPDSEFTCDFEVQRILPLK